MESRGRSGPSLRLRELYAEFRRLAVSPAGEHGPDLPNLLLHPASQEKLDAAAACVMHRAPFPRDLLGDLKQEATCLVLAKWRGGTMPYRDEGIVHFEGWLWSVWLHACVDAWRGMLPLAGIGQLKNPDRIPDGREEPESDEERWRRLWLAIPDVADPAVRSAMWDWAGGLTSVESALRHGVSKATTNRRRRRGVAALRRALGREEPPHSGR